MLLYKEDILLRYADIVKKQQFAVYKAVNIKKKKPSHQMRMVNLRFHFRPF